MTERELSRCLVALRYPSDLSQDWPAEGGRKAHATHQAGERWLSMEREVLDVQTPAIH